MTWTTRWGIAAAAAALALAPAARADDAQKSGAAGGQERTGAAGPQQPAGATGMSRHDNTDVIPSLYRANVAEIEAAKVARKNAQSQQVKDFAKQLEKDHGEVKDALAKLAKSRKLKLDDSEAKRSSQASVEQLKGLKGAELDRRFTEQMIADHERDLNDVKTALAQARQSGDHELEQVLENAKTRIEAHHRMAMDLGQASGSEQRQGRRAPARGATETSPSSTGATPSGTSTSPSSTGATPGGTSTSPGTTPAPERQGEPGHK